MLFPPSIQQRSVNLAGRQRRHIQQAKRDTELYNKINGILTTQLKKYEDDKIKQVKTTKEKENWIEFDEIRKWIEDNYKKIMYLNNNGFGYLDELQKLLIIMLYHFIPPRRLDYSDMIITTEEKYNKMDKIEMSWILAD